DSPRGWRDGGPGAGAERQAGREDVVLVDEALRVLLVVERERPGPDPDGGQEEASVRTARPARAAADSGTARRRRPVIRRIMPRSVLRSLPRVDGVLRAAVLLGGAR